MKKGLIILILLIVLSVSACKKNDNQTLTTNDQGQNTIIVNNNQVEYEIVTLTLKNYHKYITIYEQSIYSNLSKEEKTYFNFYGAEGCRFDDCIITYEGTNSGKLELSISGDGQIIMRTMRASLEITAISGTVKYPKI